MSAVRGETRTANNVPVMDLDHRYQTPAGSRSGADAVRPFVWASVITNSSGPPGKGRPPLNVPCRPSQIMARQGPRPPPYREGMDVVTAERCSSHRDL